MTFIMIGKIFCPLIAMRCLIIITVLCFVSATHAQTITPAEAKGYAGRQVTVCGRVDNLHVNKINVYLDFGGNYPNQQFEVVISGKVARRDKALKPYRDEWELKGKTVCVSGKIEVSKEHAYIVLRSLSLLKLQ